MCGFYFMSAAFIHVETLVIPTKPDWDVQECCAHQSQVHCFFLGEEQLVYNKLTRYQRGIFCPIEPIKFFTKWKRSRFFFHIMCQTGELFWWNWKKTRRVVWPTRASYCEGEIIVHVNDNEKEKVAALLNWKKINKWIKWNSKCWVWVTIIMMVSNKFWHYVNTWIQV